jgi:hypothetical protein
LPFTYAYPLALLAGNVDERWSLAPVLRPFRVWELLA